MAKAPMHIVTIFKTDASGWHIWDDLDQAVIEQRIETSDLVVAQALVRKAIRERGSHCAAGLRPAFELFDNLADYIHALNTKARLLEEFPEEGIYISEVVDSLPYWAEINVTTPRDLEEYLRGCFERGIEKSALA